MKSAFELLPTLQDPTLLVCDYDLTLAPHTDWPREPFLTGAEQAVLAAVASRATLAILTSRGSDTVRRLSGLREETAVWCTNAGLCIQGPDIFWRHPETDSSTMRIACERIRTLFAAAGDVRTLVEDKDTTAAAYWWPREAHLDRFNAAISEALAGLPVRVRPAESEANMELMPPFSWDKGDGMRKLVELTGHRGTIVAFGDSLDDEPMFRVAQALGGVGILVGSRVDTCASAQLPDREALYQFLAQFSVQGEVA